MSPRAILLTAWAAVVACASVLGPGADSLIVSQPERVAAAPLSAPDNSISLLPFVAGFSNPVYMTHAGDGSGRLFVVEKAGLIKVVKNGVVNPTPFLNLSTIVSTVGEQGLLSLAFHPQFESNGRFFVYYTAKMEEGQPPTPPPNVGSNTLAEYHVNPGSDVADPDPVRVLFSLYDRYTNHNGGTVNFGPDRYLYVSIGDEGLGGDPDNNAQNVTSLFGKLLRLDVDNDGQPFPPNFTYAIPKDNPFFGLTDPPGIRQEIFALGMRNPYRWSFDRLSGDIFIGDVGEASWEEISFIQRTFGKASIVNLGWKIREGAHCFSPPNCVKGNLVDPILEYSRTSNGTGCASITGGYRYRGNVYSSLFGTYIYADFCSGRIWKGIQVNQTWNAVEALDTTLNVSSFGEDESGELYVVSFGGSILRLAGTIQSCPTRPRVVVQTAPMGAGTIRATITATTNGSVPSNHLQSIAFTAIDNAFVTIGSQANQQSPFNVTLPPNTSSTQVTVRRDKPNTPFRVTMNVTDACGPWPTFVGAGTGFQ